RDERGFRSRRRRRSQARGKQPGRLLLWQTDHAGRASGIALDRRAAASARLLPGKRRRGGNRGDLTESGQGLAATFRNDLRRGPGADQFIMTSYYRDGLTGLPEMGLVGQQLWRQAGIAPEDVQVAILYDHFTPFVLIQLEELGFCPRGEARHFIADGAIELGGRLPVNPHGGQLGEAYIHGMNGIAEAVRQIRGTSVNQVGGNGPVLVT